MRRRRPGKLDAATSIAARLLPEFCTPWIEQARLDAKTLLDRAGGRGPSPLIESQSTPTPLHEIDPLVILPRALGERIRGAQRDVTMVGRRLIFGQTPPPLISRPPKAQGSVVSLPGKSPKMARPVKVVEVVRETPDAISVFVTEQDGSPIEFKPGQFLSVDVEIEGEVFRRAYSLANVCLPNTPSHITVKRIKDGRVSNHLNDTLEAGAELQVLGPSGNFTVEPQSLRQRRLVMIAGGSGITPIICILETILRREKQSEVVLIYGNRRWEDIIFRDRLEALATEFGPRLRVDHVLQDPPEGWEGGTGLLSSDILEARLAAIGVVESEADRYFLCGPTPMMDAAHTLLAQLGVGPTKIAEERFTRPEARHGSVGSTTPQRVTVLRGKTEHGVQVEPGQTILEAALAAGLEMPFSCAMGGCGACKVRKHEGQVEMEEPNCLSRSERVQGYVLTCVGRPLSRVDVEVEAS